MWSILALGAMERFLDHLIDLDQITRIQLNQLHGKMLRVVIDSPQLSVDVFFDMGKVRLEATPTGHSLSASLFEQRPFDQAEVTQTATATLHVPHVVGLIKLLVSDDIGNIPLQGDYHLLQDIQRIMQNTEIDLASQLSPWIGASLAHEIAKIQHIPQHLKHQLHSHMFIAEDFIKEDTGLFAPRWQMDDLLHQTRLFQQNLDRFEAKLQRLEAQLHPDSL